MNQQDLTIIDSLRDTARELESYIREEYCTDYDDFAENDILKRAVAMCLISIDQLAAGFSDSFITEHQRLIFTRFTTLRYIAERSYQSLDFFALWIAATKELPAFLTELLSAAGLEGYAMRLGQAAPETRTQAGNYEYTSFYEGRSSFDRAGQHMADRPVMGMAEVQERPLRGMQEVQERPLRGMADMPERPMRSMQDTPERPMRPMADMPERPMRGMQDAPERPMRGIQDAQERPMRGMQDTPERPVRPMPEIQERPAPKSQERPPFAMNELYKRQAYNQMLQMNMTKDEAAVETKKDVNSLLDMLEKEKRSRGL